jgi:hypothetical protein
VRKDLAQRWEASNSISVSWGGQAFMKHEAIMSSLNSGVNTLTAEGMAEVSPRAPACQSTPAREVTEKAFEFVKQFTTITARSRGELR